MNRLLRVLLLSAGLICVAAVLCYSLMPRDGFSARERPTKMEAFIAQNIRLLSIPRQAREMRNPLIPEPLTIAQARDHFADHCAVCHGNRGDGKTMINEGLYPSAPDMRKPDTQNLTDGELFFIIRNGIRLSGMPGWGGSDQDNWKLVLFIRHLPNVSPNELRFMNEINGLPAN